MILERCVFADLTLIPRTTATSFAAMDTVWVDFANQASAVATVGSHTWGPFCRARVVISSRKTLTEKRRRAPKINISGFYSDPPEDADRSRVFNCSRIFEVGVDGSHYHTYFKPESQVDAS